MKLQSHSSCSRKSSTKADLKETYKSNVDTVRKSAYKSYNNCTSFPMQDFEYIQKNHGCTFQNHLDEFFNFPGDPTKDFKLQVAILGPNAGGMLDNFYLDPLHNILNIVNMQVLGSVQTSATNINRGIDQGVSILSYSINGVTHKYFDLKALGMLQCPLRFFKALSIADSSVARNFATANDPCKSDSARSVASNCDADGSQTASLLRNVSLICWSLIYDGECPNGTEKRHYLHLWAHLTRAMANEFYTKFLYKIHFDELIAEWVGEQHHKIAILCGFNFPPNSLGFDRLQPFLMRKHRGKCIVNRKRKMA